MNKEDFSIFENFYKSEGVYLRCFDSASTTLVPDSVTDAVSFYYKNQKSSIGRSGGVLAQKGELILEDVREKVAAFLGCSSSEVAFMSGATSISNTLVRDFMEHASADKDSIIFVSESLHHALLVPILSEKEKRGFTLIYGKNSPTEIKNLYERYPSVSLLFLDHASNVTGEIYSLRESCHIARQKGSYVIVDGCQAVLSEETPLQEFSPHAYFFAGHKMYSHGGVGVLYMSADVGNALNTSSLGGGGVEYVNESEYKARPFPYSYESGTHNMGSIISLEEALSYHQKNKEKHNAYKNEVFLYAYDKISSLVGFTVYSPQNNNSGILSFSVEGIHPHDISYMAGERGIVLRAGFFCSEIYARHFDSRGLVRISFAPYVTHEDVDYLIETLREIQKKFSL